MSDKTLAELLTDLENESYRALEGLTPAFKMDCIHNEIIDRFDRLRDAERIAWALVNGLQGYGARQDANNRPLPCLVWSRENHIQDGKMRWLFLSADDEFIQDKDWLNFERDMPVLSAAARAAIDAARKEAK